MFGEYAKPLKQQEGETKTGLWQPAQGCARARTHGLGCARARTHGNPTQHTHRFRKASGSMGLGGGVAAFCGGVLMRSLPCARASLSSRLIRRSRISATVRIPWSPGILQARRGAVRRLHSQRAAMASQPAPRDLHPKIQDKALTVGVCTPGKRLQQRTAVCSEISVPCRAVRRRSSNHRRENTKCEPPVGATL
jgi:hypothetical protein